MNIAVEKDYRSPKYLLSHITESGVNTMYDVTGVALAAFIQD